VLPHETLLPQLVYAGCFGKDRKIAGKWDFGGIEEE
jgi:hypothetical protein